MHPAEPSRDAEHQIDAATLRGHPVPDPDHADKFVRGQVLVIGGDREIPGGVVLAALAALRSGAGRAHVVTDPSAALALAVATPEIRVSPLPERIVECGDDAPLATAVRRADAVLVGSGWADAERAADVLRFVAPRLSSSAALLLDAAALSILGTDGHVLAGVDGRAILLPIPAEAADALGRPAEAVEHDPCDALRTLVAAHSATVAIRGTTTWISGPGAGLFVERGGHAALGTSGSGDVLAGAVAGLAARGASPLAALLWGVHAHAGAGHVLAERDGGIGLLARELLDELPRQLNQFSRSPA